MSKLKDLLEGAYQVCTPCGKKYGRRPQGGRAMTFRNGCCDICDRDTNVTEFRDFGYERDLEPREQLTKEHLPNE